MRAYPHTAGLGARAALAASALALFGFSAPAAAQVSGGTNGSTQGRDVSAGTCGQGTTDGSSINVSGCANAEARNGGTVDTSTRAKTNARVGMQRSVANAQDDDERARSRTRTMVRQGDTVRSRTTTRYKAEGERPVRESVTTVTTPEGTTTKTSGRPPKPKGR